VAGFRPSCLLLWSSGSTRGPGFPAAWGKPPPGPADATPQLPTPSARMHLRRPRERAREARDPPAGPSQAGRTPGPRAWKCEMPCQPSTIRRRFPEHRGKLPSRPVAGLSHRPPSCPTRGTDGSGGGDELVGGMLASATAGLVPGAAARPAFPDHDRHPGNELHDLLTLWREAERHGGNPPPRRERPRRPSPPSTSLSSKGEERVDGRAGGPAADAAGGGPLIRSPAPNLPLRLVGRRAIDLPDRISSAPSLDVQAPRLPIALGDRLHHCLTLRRQAERHGGNPPPRRERPRRPFPPSASLSSKGEARVNGRAGGPAADAAAGDPLVRSLAPGLAPWLVARRASLLGGRISPAPSLDGPPRSASAWGHELHDWLTLRCQAERHGGNPPPRRERPRRTFPPSASLSSEGEERVNGRAGGPAADAAGGASRARHGPGQAAPSRRREPTRSTRARGQGAPRHEGEGADPGSPGTGLAIIPWRCSIGFTGGSPGRRLRPVTCRGPADGDHA
jgi:hypothetical protein